MSPERRIFNRRETVVALAAGLAVGVSFSSRLAAQTPQATLKALVDVIIPRDDQSPSASDLGVHLEIQDALAGQPDLTKLVGMGLNWLDNVAPEAFADLSADQQAEVIAFAANADFNSGPGRFYYVARLFAIQFYYEKAEAIPGLPLNGAPQPNGYPPPWH